MSEFKIEIPMGEIKAFCKKWKVKEFALFGSVLREDFDFKKSDLDILLEYSNDAKWTLFHVVRMRDELKEIFGREVDLVSKKAIERSPNPFRKKEILETAKVIYAKAA